MPTKSRKYQSKVWITIGAGEGIRTPAIQRDHRLTDDVVSRPTLTEKASAPYQIPRLEMTLSDPGSEIRNGSEHLSFTVEEDGC